MALTPFQRKLCRLLAEQRIASGESYVAGGVALNEILGAPRLSRDIDLFHDTESALDASFRADRETLERAGLSVHPLRERQGFVEAEVQGQGEGVVLQWTRDSAYRFFPLVTHPELGMTLHPLDLATNKVLALVGRIEVRDWVDVIECSERLQPLGYLAWAACGKDPGFGPRTILEHASRSSRYSAEEVSALSFDGPPPDAGELSRRWRAHLADAEATIALLPAEHAGTCVLSTEHEPLQARGQALSEALQHGAVVFHRGSIRGAWPEIVGVSRR